MERQFTAGVYIIDEQKVLLIFHRKFKKWLPPGGHLEPNETPPEAARREAREETGLEIAFVPQDNVVIDRWNAKSIERPYMVLLEEIPAIGLQAAHQHIDFLYVATPAGGTELRNTRETEDMRWFNLEEIDALVPDQDIFAETQETLRAILQQYSLLKVKK